jgi:hypothetical protein
MKILKIFPADGTFNQVAQFDRTISLANKATSSSSFDLTKATDRFPLALQILALGALYSLAFANA